MLAPEIFSLAPARMHGAKQAAANRPYTGTPTFNHSKFGASLRINATFVQIHTVRRIDAFPRAFLCFPRVIRLREASISIQSVPRGYAMSTFPNFALERRAPREFRAVPSVVHEFASEFSRVATLMFLYLKTQYLRR